MHQDPEVMRYFPDLLTPEQSEWLAEDCRIHLERRDWGMWAVESLHSGEFIGFVGLHIPDADLPFGPCIEIAWRLKRSAWGQGYATEAARAVLRVAFERLGLQEIVSFTSVLNTPSQAVMERLGMTRDPQTFQHPSVPLAHRLCEHCLYRLSVADWRRQL